MQQNASKLPMAAITAFPAVFSFVKKRNYVLRVVFEVFKHG
jgi:hypothetical protein